MKSITICGTALALMLMFSTKSSTAQSQSSKQKTNAVVTHKETLPSTGAIETDTTVPDENVASLQNPGNIPAVSSARQRQTIQESNAWIKSFRAWSNNTPDYMKYLDEKEKAYVEQSLWSSLYQYRLHKSNGTLRKPTEK